MIARRLPLRVRPLVFVAGAALFVLGTAMAINVDWDFSLFTGNLLLQLVVTGSVFPQEGTGWSMAALAVLGLGLVAWSFTRPRGRALFYPLAALLGLFVTVFGATYLFDVTVSAEKTATGSVAFVFFDYAGLFHRPFQTGFGFVVLVVGLVLLGRGSFGARPLARARAPPPETFAVVDGSDARPVPAASRPSPPATATRANAPAPRPTRGRPAAEPRARRAPTTAR